MTPQKAFQRGRREAQARASGSALLSDISQKTPSRLYKSTDPSSSDSAWDMLGILGGERGDLLSKDKS